MFEDAAGVVEDGDGEVHGGVGVWDDLGVYTQ